MGRGRLGVLSRSVGQAATKLASAGARVAVMGSRDRFSPRRRRVRAKVEERTAAGDRATLTLALD